MADRLLIAILAAGASRRLGLPKQLVRLNGEALIHRQARIALEAKCGDAVVILGAASAECASAIADLSLTTRFNHEWEEGMAASIREAMSPEAHRRHGAQLHHYYAHRSGDGTDGWRQLAIEDRKASIPDLAAFRINFAQWLKSLTRRDRRIIAAFVSGERTMAVSERIGISEARVSQLRRKYEREWTVFQREGGMGQAA